MKTIPFIFAFFLVSCCPNLTKDTHDEQFLQIYYHHNLHTLDTFHGIYQKDLITDGYAKTTMWLTMREQEMLLTKLEHYRFFSWPDTLHRQPGVFQSPDGGTHILRVKYKEIEKIFVWYDTSDTSTFGIDRIGELLYDIISSKTEYKALPEEKAFPL